jgi:hypothetical protein
MNVAEAGPGSLGACTAGNFLARRLAVNQHGAILGMRKPWDSTSSVLQRPNGRVRVGLSKGRQPLAVNPFLTINRAKIAG